jgi:hypothetical protein
MAGGSTVSWSSSAARPRQTQHRDLARDSEMSETCETNEMLPFLAPMDCGAKMALKVKLSPLARVKVKSSPITANPVPRVVTCNRLSSESPALVIVTIPNFLWRRATFPKPRVAGVKIRCRLHEAGLPRATSDACARGIDASSIAITAGARRDRDVARESRMAPVLLRLIGQEKLSVVHPGKIRGGNRRPLNICLFLWKST